jgi:2-dehydro-3-deoxyphosphogluconate aldolase/(4S)-4-hydroxy-2-oxoglutarate aldolase
LLSGGITAMELTLRTPAALQALRAIRREVPKMTAGVGTILTTKQVQQVSELDAAFGVAPGTNVRVIKAAQKLDLPFVPGVATPSDIEQALECGCRLLKFFPAEESGGLKYLKSIAAPYAHLQIRFIPLGGLNADNMSDYLVEPSVIALGGSWIAPRELIRRRDWDAIGHNALIASRRVKRLREQTKA